MSDQPGSLHSEDAVHTPADNRSMAKIATAGLVGTVIEFYDFLTYATVAALMFAHAFFPDQGVDRPHPFQG